MKLPEKNVPRTSGNIRKFNKRMLNRVMRRTAKRNPEDALIRKMYHGTW